MEILTWDDGQRQAVCARAITSVMSDSLKPL